jgi:branched-chain amino acid transport system permease protein
MIVLGGLGSVPGSIVGAFVVTVGPEWLRFLKDYRLIVYALIILSVLIFAPRGLYGLVDGAWRRLAGAPARAEA